MDRSRSIAFFALAALGASCHREMAPAPHGTGHEAPPLAADVAKLPEGLEVGMRAPDFDAKDVDGKPFKLSDYRGKVVLLDFWGFW